jgi:hypothetical protein
MSDKLTTLKQIIELDIQFYNIQIESIKKNSIEKYSTILINYYEIKIQTLTDVIKNINDLL